MSQTLSHMLKSCEVSNACVCVCFRSRSGLHCISKGSQSDAGGPAVGGALLLHAAAARTGQSGDQHTLYHTFNQLRIFSISLQE